MKGIVGESVWCESCDNLHTLIDEGAYCVKCIKFFDAGCLNEIAGEPVCFKCSPAMCGDHITPIGECGCKL